MNKYKKKKRKARTQSRNERNFRALLCQMIFMSKNDSSMKIEISVYRMTLLWDRQKHKVCVFLPMRIGEKL